MDILHPSNATRVLKAPKEWDTETQGECGDLPIIDLEQDGQKWMMSVWRLSDDEIELLKKGHGLIVQIMGTQHPVIAVGLTSEDVSGI
ncbi:hypothetical protein PJWF_00100 [Achromobacter phage JWF]|uniref:hypothetical protein n=1 Tax=Achromobacter phage JWF TaxID=1589748 RepID=UPI000588E070|nr:hypothetical protein AXJ13_gp088 [Achromobacter phage JWF]AJD82993.1 hypothetical protein PJWF_00100 [Achromobacter phage JWF]